MCARPTKQQQQVLVHHRQPWRTRRRCHRARAARSMVDSAPRASTSLQCQTSARGPSFHHSKYWYIVGNLGAIGGGATVHEQRGRWSTLHNAPRRVDIVRNLRSSRRMTTASTGTSLASLAQMAAAPPRTGCDIDGRHSFARHNGSTMSDKCGRPATRYWPVVVHHRQCCGRRRRRWHVSSATTTRFGSSVSTMPNICARHGDGGFQTAALD
jgi:hypothetical protein